MSVNGAAAIADEEVGATSTRAFWPSPPQTIAESGLEVPFIEDHLIRMVYTALQMNGAELAAGCGLPYVAIQPIIRTLARDHLFDAVGQTAVMESSVIYALGPKGRDRAQESLSRTWYQGPLPVPLDTYVAAVKAQSIGQLMIHQDALREALSDLVISDEFLDRLGPAVNTGSSLFLYGSPGNGKTMIAERLAGMMGGTMFIPYAVEIDGSIVMLYDQLNHRVVDEPTVRRHDARWVRIRRPSIFAGSELTLESLDLIWHESGKYYEAPYQMKANGGTFLIDDFGRQLVRPVDLLNRWIVPLERRIDFLTLRTGQKFQVPFDPLLILSTNLNPADLADEAFQRRIRFRVSVPDASEAEFIELFRQICEVRNVEFDMAAFNWLLETWYRPTGRPRRFVHPRDLINQLVAIANYLQQPLAMTPELLDRACRSYFVQETTGSQTAARVH
ncbi:MAG TPA: ATP-binding protein [Chloroflexota bacterium]|nr:ATP-binding protein [Chloroflexota bacterium]